MGGNMILDPSGVATAVEPALLQELLPFSYTIATYRNRNNYQQDGGMCVRYSPQAQAHPHPDQRPPSDSFISITYCLSSSPSLRDQYQRFRSPFLRIGLLLEDLDSLAADVACRHLGGLPEGATVVTASVDKVAFSTAQSKHQHGSSSSPGSSGAEGGEAGITAGGTAAGVAGPEAGAPDEGRDGVEHEEHRPVDVQTDLRLAAQVCWTGRSSMEVIIEICTAAPCSTAAPAAVPAAGAAALAQGAAAAEPAAADAPEAAVGAGVAGGGGGAGGAAHAEQRWLHRAFAHFVMVLRPKAPGVDTSGWRVPRVVPINALEQARFDAAAARAEVNRARRSRGRLLSGVEPAGDEVKLLYELAEAQLQRELQEREKQDTQARSSGAGTPPAARHPAPLVPMTPVPIHATARTHLAIMHRQDRNNAGSIFGGHLIKLAAELAYSTAVLHAGRHCEAVAMGDITFKQPVPIGCVLEFRAKVVYTCGPLLRVAVVATKHQQLMERPSHLHAAITNDFTFVLVAVGSHPLRPVEPESLREVVQYLAAHRLHLADEYQAPPLLLREGMEHVLVG